MALINCPECEKEISDKAISCPNCGVPLNENKPIFIEKTDNEEYLCCPKCMSKELHAQHKGFSGGKALAGVVLTGGIGLLAGTIGSKDVQITCLKCGNKFKSGDAKTTSLKQISSKKDELEKEIIELFCEKGSDVNTYFKAQSLCKERLGLSDTETNSFLDKCIEKIPENLTIEQRERHSKKQDEILNKNTGCFGIFLLLLLPCILFLIS